MEFSKYFIESFHQNIFHLLIDIYLNIYFSDYIVVGSDSGRIVILEYIPQKNVFERVSFS